MDVGRKHDIVGYGKIGYCKTFQEMGRYGTARHGTTGQGVIARYGKMRYNTAGCGRKVEVPKRTLAVVVTSTVYKYLVEV